MTHRGPCQPRAFYDSVIHLWKGRELIEISVDVYSLCCERTEAGRHGPDFMNPQRVISVLFGIFLYRSERLNAANLACNSELG